MSHLLSLGGVACTTKTTILKRINEFNNNNIVVHLEDYKELNEKYQFDCRVGNLLYAAYRCKNAEQYKQDFDNVHIFYRQPMESLIYATIKNNINETDSMNIFESCRKMDLHSNWISFILTTNENSENRLVKIMKKRDNKLDEYTVRYVKEQNKKYKLWNNVFGNEEIVIDWRKDIIKQQNDIINIINNRVFHNWNSNDNGLFIYDYKVPLIKNKIAGFDLDGTLICTKSGNAFSMNNFDWKLKYLDIREKFLKLLKKDYSIVVMTNELGLSPDKLSNLKRKIENVCQQINLPMLVLISSTMNNYRKPCTGMFEYLQQHKQQYIDINNSFYCGDNANGTLNTDSVFAKALGIKFYYDFDYFTIESEC
ncbi:nicotinamide riboside kinase 1 [Apocheima cinerarium nucleopolyhedrovirus]|uniref:nicotinamide riboside kinase 1 n=1 Tax=Apocheima cinerarium nucleopolyhedrovirus TaxID=307461 RepID=UPI0001D920B7|nr:nicotinamide riboside kinase 1 [Apocheima cinerarium nucleopolyhedrovirus]ADB84444.1 nicotinamide riboside kinase 1 [Apocheima cinerarium nucleopolyhedrovirus]